MENIVNEDMLEKAKKDFANNASKKAAEDALLAKAAFTAFNSESGKFVLEHFKKFTTHNPMPICNPLTESPERADRMGYYRSGQNSIIWEILSLIEKGSKGE